jgi:hypothetical protein
VLKGEFEVGFGGEGGALGEELLESLGVAGHQVLGLLGVVGGAVPEGRSDVSCDHALELGFLLNFVAVISDFL